MNKKDNPVPLIDKINEFLDLNKHVFKELARDSYIKDIKQGIKEILENGVETNNEQPDNFFKNTELDY